jgi:hypothetical protein
MKMKKTSFLTLMVATLAVIIASFSACQEEYVTERVDDPTLKSGNLIVRLTDAPFPTGLVAEANVTIDKIEIRRSNDDDEYPFITLSEEEQSFNLLDLTNGVTAILADTSIESGLYNQIRMHVTEASILLTDSTLYDLFIPSGQQTGIKVNIDPDIMVDSLTNQELILDFDVSRSFVVQGNPNTPAGIKGFIFKPVIKATAATTSGTLEGTVTDTADVAISGAQVSIIAADTVYTTSFTEETGAYEILGIDEGIYKVEFAKEGFTDTIVENVEIIAGEKTTLDAKLNSN